MNPQCGFLLTGAVLENWQVTKFVSRHGTTDSYIATAIASTPSSSDTGEQERAFIKVFRHCPPGSLLRLEKLLALHHPFLHPYRRTGWLNQGGSLYLISHYEKWGSLARYLHSGTPLPLATIAGTLVQVAQALHYLHGQNLIHGHLLPENCLIVDQATTQVSDFYHNLLTREAIIEPSLYTAPEQGQGSHLPASDQYSLAILACHLLACHLRFPATENTYGRQPRPQPWTLPPEKILHALPRSVQQTLLRALGKDANQRFPDILEFAFTLQQALGQERQRQHSGPIGMLTETSPLARSDTTSGPLSQDSGPMRALKVYRSTSGELPKQTKSPQTRPGLAAPPARLPGHTSEISILRWNTDGKLLASVESDRQIMIWYVRQRVGTPIGDVTGHQAAIKTLSWSTDGQALASAADDGSLCIWRVTTTPAFQIEASTSWWGHDGSIATLEWAPNSPMLASGGRDQMLHIWDKQGNKLTSWQAHSRGGITSLAWSPDGNRLATGGSDGLIYLWDMNSGRRFGPLAGHTDEIRRLRWSPDGRLLASSAGKKDTRIALWDAQTVQRLALFSGHKREIVGLFWHANGTWLISAGTDRSIHYWNIVQPAEIIPGEQLEMSGTALVMDGNTSTNMLAVGTSDMLMLLLQLN